MKSGIWKNAALLISARKNPRRWKSLNKAIEFVEVMFPVTELRVTVSPRSAAGKAKARRRQVKKLGN